MTPDPLRTKLQQIHDDAKAAGLQIRWWHSGEILVIGLPVPGSPSTAPAPASVPEPEPAPAPAAA